MVVQRTRGRFESLNEGRLFCVGLEDGQVQLLAGPQAGQDPDELSASRDSWQSCTWGSSRLRLSHLKVDAMGEVVGWDDDTNALVRVHLGLTPPAHMQPPPAPSWDVASCSPIQATEDLGELLQLGKGADAVVRCAGGQELGPPACAQRAVGVDLQQARLQQQCDRRCRCSEC